MAPVDSLNLTDLAFAAGSFRVMVNFAVKIETMVLVLTSLGCELMVESMVEEYSMVVIMNFNATVVAVITADAIVTSLVFTWDSFIIAAFFTKNS